MTSPGGTEDEEDERLFEEDILQSVTKGDLIVLLLGLVNSIEVIAALVPEIADAGDEKQRANALARINGMLRVDREHLRDFLRSNTDNEKLGQWEQDKAELLARLNYAERAALNPGGTRTSRPGRMYGGRRLERARNIVKTRLQEYIAVIKPFGAEDEEEREARLAYQVARSTYAKFDGDPTEFPLDPRQLSPHRPAREQAEEVQDTDEAEAEAGPAAGAEVERPDIPDFLGAARRLKRGEDEA